MCMNIVIVMNIYITQENQQFLRSRKQSMSGTVNLLLDQFRQMDKSNIEHQKHVRANLEFTDSVEKNGHKADMIIENELSSNPVIKTPKQAKKAVKKIQEEKKQSNFCEHFQPKGQCLWKGCKFA